MHRLARVAFRAQIRVSGLVDEPLCFALQEHSRVGLAQEQEGNEGEEPADDRDDLEDPSPAAAGYKIPARYGTNDWSQERSQGVDCYHSSSLLLCDEVCDCAAAYEKKDMVLVSSKSIFAREWIFSGKGRRRIPFVTGAEPKQP